MYDHLLIYVFILQNLAVHKCMAVSKENFNPFTPTSRIKSCYLVFAFECVAIQIKAGN